MNFGKLVLIIGFVLFLAGFSIYVVAKTGEFKEKEVLASSKCACSCGIQNSYDTDPKVVVVAKPQQADHTATKRGSLHFLADSSTSDQDNHPSQVQMEFAADLCNQFCDCVPNGSMPNGWTGRQSSIGRWEHCSPCTLLRWSLSGLPSDIIVTKATIKLYCDSRWGQISGQLLFAPATELWNRTVTYNTRPTIDVNSAVETAWPSNGQWFEVDIKSIVGQWAKGTLSNYGIQAYSTSTARTGGIDIRSPGWNEPQYRPKLTITYDHESSTSEKSPYLGQKPPGFVPEIFAPGIICLENRFEQNATFTPDGNEFCFTVTNAGWSWSDIWYTKQKQGRWTEPEPAGFLGSGDAWCPYFSPDGEGFYFTSSRPNYPPTNIWICEKTLDGWAAPIKLGSPVSSSRDEWGFSVQPDKSIYLCSHRPGGSGGCDIWYCNYVNGQYSAENISIMNTTGNDCSPYVPPDQSFLVFNSDKPGGYGQADLYISYRLEDGTWSTPGNLGPNINTPAIENAFSMSPDTKYCFFSRRTNSNSDIYWVDARAVISKLCQNENGPIKNISTGIRYDLIQCAINDAGPGDQIVVSEGFYEENITLSDKDIILQSIDPNNPDVVAATVICGKPDAPVITFTGNNEDCMLTGFTITGGSTGITCSGASPAILNCNITQNHSAGIELLNRSNPNIQNCIIAENTGAGIKMVPMTAGRITLYNQPNIINCTIAVNLAEGISGGKATITNSIIYYNGNEPNVTQIKPVSVTVTYSDIQGGCEGQGNIDAEPCFAQLGYRDPNGTPDDPNDDFWVAGDYHLKSQAGHWYSTTQVWVIDDVTSPCIDTGDISSPIGLEPSPNGGVINMGAYGGTVQASKSYIDG